MLAPFFASIVVAHVVLVPLCVLSSPVDLRLSLTSLYEGILTAGIALLPFCLMESLTSLHSLVLVLLVVGATIGLRFQIGVTDTDYLRTMLGRHSTSLLLSEARVARSSDPGIRVLADQVVREQTIERKLMKEKA
jgi:hypothetical protein